MNTVGETDAAGAREALPSAARLVAGLATGALIVGMAITLFVYLIASLTRGEADNPAQTTLDAMPTIFGCLLGAGLTLGFAASRGLLAAGLTGPLWWSLSGGVLGAAVGVAYAVVGGLAIRVPLLVTCALVGWALLLIVRRIVGVR
ncbi:MAG: hypothetical protein AAGC57_07335 [Pseudomonadota bacterium]